MWGEGLQGGGVGGGITGEGEGDGDDAEEGGCDNMTRNARLTLMLEDELPNCHNQERVDEFAVSNYRSERFLWKGIELEKRKCYTSPSILAITLCLKSLGIGGDVAGYTETRRCINIVPNEYPHRIFYHVNFKRP